MKMKLSLIKKVLFLILIFSIAYISYSIIFQENTISYQENLKTSKNLKLFGRFTNNFQRDYKAFLKNIEEKKVFSPSFVVGRGLLRNAEKLSTTIDNLRLAGIISVEPKKAIIEDSRKGESFYLEEGDIFLEDIQVEVIGKDSVILNYQGESFELHL